MVVSGKKSSDLKVAEIMTKEEVLKTVSPSGANHPQSHKLVLFCIRHRHLHHAPHSYLRSIRHNVPRRLISEFRGADTVLAAMELMIDHNFRHVPVVSLVWEYALVKAGHFHLTSSLSSTY